MKLRGIFAIFALSVIAKGAWWSEAVQPVIMALVAVIATIDLDLEPIEWRNYLPFLNKQEETPETPSMTKE